MVHGVKGVIALISVCSTEGNNDHERQVRWRLGIKTPSGVIETHKQGIITVPVLSHFKGVQVDQIAELCALYDLLVTREVLGVGRGGNGLLIECSHGAIKKYVTWFKGLCDMAPAERENFIKAGKDKNAPSEYLSPYATFLLYRFFDAELQVNKDVSWVKLKNELKQKNITAVSLCNKLGDIITVDEKHGKVEISMHSIERVVMRNNCTHQEAWRFIVNQLRSRYTRLITEQHAKDNRLEKKHITGDRWHNPESGWIYAIQKQEDYSVLTTMMVAVY